MLFTSQISRERQSLALVAVGEGQRRGPRGITSPGQEAKEGGSPEEQFFSQGPVG